MLNVKNNTPRPLNRESLLLYYYLAQGCIRLQWRISTDCIMGRFPCSCSHQETKPNTFQVVSGVSHKSQMFYKICKHRKLLASEFKFVLTRRSFYFSLTVFALSITQGCDNVQEATIQKWKQPLSISEYRETKKATWIGQGLVCFCIF